MRGTLDRPFGETEQTKAADVYKFIIALGEKLFKS